MHCLHVNQQTRARGTNLLKSTRTCPARVDNSREAQAASSLLTMKTRQGFLGRVRGVIVHPDVVFMVVLAFPPSCMSKPVEGSASLSVNISALPSQPAP